MNQNKIEMMNLFNRNKRQLDRNRDDTIHNEKALIYQSELDFISRCVLDYPDIETGGDFFGSWTTSGHPIVQYVIGPGENANHNVAFFNQDAEYLEKSGKILREKYGLQHIGTWHSHHKLGLPTPSGHDISTIVSAIKNYNLTKFLMVICSIDNENSTILNGCMLHKDKYRDYDKVGWVVLPEESPIRNRFDNSFDSNWVTQPKTIQPRIRQLSTTDYNKPVFAKADFTKNSWLDSKNGQAELKNIVNELKNKYGNIKVWQNSDKSVSLFLTENNNIEIHFPVNFPDTDFEIKTKSSVFETTDNEIKSIVKSLIN